MAGATLDSPCSTTDVTVHVVDDNPDIRESACRLVRTIGLVAVAHPGGVDFLEHYDPEIAGCVVLDLAMPGLSGLQVQDALNDFAVPPPVIFITGHAEVPYAVKAMRAGAIDFLVKPFCAKTLLMRVQEAVDHDLENRRQNAMQGRVHGRLERLTKRERQIARRLSMGESSKHIAHELGISPKTAENHRAKVLEKLEVDNPTQLANLLAQLPEFASSSRES